MRRLHIAQIAPLAERVPPRKYGGTELVIANLINELVRRGHRVTLLGRSDSRTAARLVPFSDPDPRAKLRFHTRGYHIPHYWQTLQLGWAFERARQFDVIHCHIGSSFFPFSRLVKTPTVLTLHGRLNTRETKVMHGAYAEQPLVSISNNQREPLPKLNYIRTVYNGIDLRRFPMGHGRGNYLAFLGRMSPEKGPVQAIQAAKRAGIPLIMAAKVDDADKVFFAKKIKPHLDGRRVKFLGEVAHAEKIRLLKDARGLLALIQWEEPFGLFMTEAMACGTPVIATGRGSVPEIVADGKTGFIVQNANDAARAIKNLGRISRAACRDRVVRKFSMEAMVDGYEAVYGKLIKHNQ